MKKIIMMVFAASMAMGTGAAFAEDSGSNNGAANQANDPGSIQKIAPNNVDNSKINNTDQPVNEVHKDKAHKNTTKKHSEAHKKTVDHKKAMCKDGRCPDQVPGTNKSKATGN